MHPNLLKKKPAVQNRILIFPSVQNSMLKLALRCQLRKQLKLTELLALDLDNRVAHCFIVRVDIQIVEQVVICNVVDRNERVDCDVGVATQ